MILCGGREIPAPEGGWPDEPDTPCCEGMWLDGWAACTCWVPVFNHDHQAPPDETAAKLLAAGLEPTVRPGGMCGDCAYRPDSPEKSGDENYRGDADFLERIAQDGERFWCHDGMLLVTEWRHPSGLTVPGHPGAYIPPIEAAVPYRADGQPGYLCAGWAARRKAIEAKLQGIRERAATRMEG
ncbi:hypothetical protein [Amycolatopsis thermoflava]|uniref:hypothetical protein n=1 Tax=Amycolatopsis thermoflava TaxID=84480 RepID=UPI003827F5E6